MRRCVVCGDFKPLEEFSFVVAKKTGKRYPQSWCKRCMRIAALEWQWQHYSDDDRARILARRERVANNRWKREIAAKVKSIGHLCAYCGELTNRPVYCSKRCNGLANGQKRRRGIRARSDGSVRRFDVFEADRWTCGICGIAVDARMPPMSPLGPTLDHIIPLARGGEHVRSNVRLAHRICNMREGGRLKPVFHIYNG